MSRLYGQVESDTGSSPAHRPSNEQETAWIQTELARLEITLHSNCDYEVMRYNVRSRSAQNPGATLLRGNLHEDVSWTPARSIVKPD
jgi:hypothetical protein